MLRVCQVHIYSLFGAVWLVFVWIGDYLLFSFFFELVESGLNERTIIVPI